jgi:tripartite-type tricarboxylate transporter receptor subunit TctC
MMITLDKQANMLIAFTKPERIHRRPILHHGGGQMKKLLAVIFSLFFFAALTLVPVSAAPAPSAADFYKGKIVTILLTAPAGSTNDIFARLAVPYLSELTGAKIAVENKTAAGGMVAQNEFFQVVKPDGLTIMCEATGRLWPGWLMGEKGINYDINKFEYMSGLKGGPYLLGVSPKGPYGTIELLKKGKNLKVPTSTPGSILSLAAEAVAEALSLDVKLVIGVPSDAAYLALQQGEAHFMVRSFDSAIKFQKQGSFKPLLQVEDQRDPLVPDLPTLGEVTALSDYHKKLVNVLFAEAKIFLAPPGTPKDRVQFWDDCITKLLKNTDFQNKIKENFGGVWFGAYTSAECKKKVAYLSAHKEDIKLYTPLVSKYIK